MHQERLGGGLRGVQAQDMACPHFQVAPSGFPAALCSNLDPLAAVCSSARQTQYLRKCCRICSCNTSGFMPPGFHVQKYYKAFRNMSLSGCLHVCICVQFVFQLNCQCGQQTGNTNEQRTERRCVLMQPGGQGWWMDGCDSHSTAGRLGPAATTTAGQLSHPHLAAAPGAPGPRLAHQVWFSPLADGLPLYPITLNRNPEI